MAIIDAHTHSFPSAEMGNAWQSLVGIKPTRSGEISELVSAMDASGIDRAVVLLFFRGLQTYKLMVDDGIDADVARQKVRVDMRAYNSWGCEYARKNPRIVPFIGVDPRFAARDEMVEDIRQAIAAGARGVKFIPPQLRMYGNDRLLYPVYELCVELGVPVLSQSGMKRGPKPHPLADPYSRPRYFADVMMTFPTLRLVLAHMGHDFEDDIVDLCSKYPNLYTDTSSAVPVNADPTSEEAVAFVALVRRIGVEKVLFGSNFPMNNPADYVWAINRLPFEPAERTRLLSENFATFMDEA